MFRSTRQASREFSRAAAYRPSPRTMDRKRACNCRIVAEQAGEPGRQRGRAFLADAPHRHACMLRLDHHRNAARLQGLLDRVDDLRGQMLLGLQPAGEHIDQPRQLREPDHPVDRRIGDVRLAVERHHMVLAMRGEADVAHQHEIVVAGGLAERPLEQFVGRLVVAAKQLVIGLDHAPGRIEQALAGGVLADIGQQRLDRSFGLGRETGARLSEAVLSASAPAARSGLITASIRLSVRPALS